METKSEHPQIPPLPERSAFRQINDLGEPLKWVRSQNPTSPGFVRGLPGIWQSYQDGKI